MIKTKYTEAYVLICGECHYRNSWLNIPVAGMAVSCHSTSSLAGGFAVGSAQAALPRY